MEELPLTSGCERPASPEPPHCPQGRSRWLFLTWPGSRRPAARDDYGVCETENHGRQRALGFLQWLTASPLSDLRLSARPKDVSSQFSFSLPLAAYPPLFPLILLEPHSCYLYVARGGWGGRAASLPGSLLPLHPGIYTCQASDVNSGLTPSGATWLGAPGQTSPGSTMVGGGADIWPHR